MHFDAGCPPNSSRGTSLRVTPPRHRSRGIARRASSPICAVRRKARNHRTRCRRGASLLQVPSLRNYHRARWRADNAGTQRPCRNARVHRCSDRTVSTNIAAFTLAAFFEIAGCFAFWMWLRRGVTPLVALVGLASLICLAVAASSDTKRAPISAVPARSLRRRRKAGPLPRDICQPGPAERMTT